MAPNAMAYIATSQKGMACTPKDPKCGHFFFIFLDFGQIAPQPFLASRGQPRGGGGGGQPTQSRLGTPPEEGAHTHSIKVSSANCLSRLQAKTLFFCHMQLVRHTYCAVLLFCILPLICY